LPHFCGHSADLPATSTIGAKKLVHPPAIGAGRSTVIASIRVSTPASSVEYLPDAVPLTRSLPLRI
jgi:hypothetical protein